MADARFTRMHRSAEAVGCSGCAQLLSFTPNRSDPMSAGVQRRGRCSHRLIAVDSLYRLRASSCDRLLLGCSCLSGQLRAGVRSSAGGLDERTNGRRADRPVSQPADRSRNDERTERSPKRPERNRTLAHSHTHAHSQMRSENQRERNRQKVANQTSGKEISANSLEASCAISSNLISTKVQESSRKHDIAP